MNGLRILSGNFQGMMRGMYNWRKGNMRILPYMKLLRIWKGIFLFNAPLFTLKVFTVLRGRVKRKSKKSQREKKDTFWHFFKINTIFIYFFLTATAFNLCFVLFRFVFVLGIFFYRIRTTFLLKNSKIRTWWIQLIRKINYEAADSDLKLIRDDLQRLNKWGIFVCFQHIPSHKGLIHNVIADRLANEATNIDPQPESKLRNLRDIMKHRGQIKCLPFRNSPFRSREDTVWYYRLKSGYLFLNSVRFQWNLYDSPLCRWCLTTEETSQHIFFYCHILTPETNKIKIISKILKIEEMFDSNISLQLPPNTERPIYRVMIQIMKKTIENELIY